MTLHSLAVYCEVEANPGTAPDTRALTVYSDVTIDTNDVLSRGLTAYSEVQPNPILESRALAIYNVVKLRVAADTPLEIQLLDAADWNIEKILGVK